VKLRHSTLFSSQVLPTQACYVALLNSRASLSLDQQDAISLSLKKMSQSFGDTGKGDHLLIPTRGTTIIQVEVEATAASENSVRAGVSSNNPNQQPKGRGRGRGAQQGF
jgi:hypothetical protein